MFIYFKKWRHISTDKSVCATIHTTNEEKYFLNVIIIICLLDISQIRWHFMFHLPPFNFLRRRPQRVEEGGRESDDSPDGDDEEEAEVTEALLDLLAHGRNQQIVDDVGRKKERVYRAAVAGQKKSII